MSNVKFITKSPAVVFVFKGMDEAERLVRIGQRLYETKHTPWHKLTKSQRRAYVDQACDRGHESDMQ